ncbi:chlorophyll a/b-binding protein domain-containing protein [Pelagophyceae sp. CCMP2097]|nr:chlorophyll a/b-binding protein domain-containing protein [Pelagophyceae sp. CCMP2097]
MSSQLVLLACLAPALALQPKAPRKAVLKASTLGSPSDFAYGLPGNSMPGAAGSRFDFDPLRFAERGTQADVVKYREAELKHGRVAMLAATGMLVSELWHPLLLEVVNVPSIYAFQLTLQKEFFFVPLLAGIAAVEGLSIFGYGGKPAGWSTDLKFKMSEDYKAGSYGEVGPWTAANLSAEDYELKEVQELNNGRLAMLAVAGIVAQELVTSQPVVLPIVEYLAKVQPDIGALFA